MKTEHNKILASIPNASWPIVGALAFIGRFGNEYLATLLKCDSFKWQLDRYSGGREINEFMKIAETLEIAELKQVERIFEGSLEIDTKKAEGAVYTPDFIIDFILDKTLSKENLPSIEHPLLDPACGSGGFLVRAAQKISELIKTDFASATAFVCGSDINPKAVANAKLLLDLASLTKSGKLSNARICLFDSLLLDIENQFTTLGILDGVSVLVTNPPYVKLQNLDHNYSAELSKKFPEIASGAFSLASLFLFNSVNYLLPEGKAGFITLNNVFTSLSGKGLRQTWSRDRTIERIIDFRHFSIFDASAYTCLIFLDRKQKSEFKYNAVSQLPTYEYLKKLEPTLISYGNLQDNKWRLGDKSSLKLISAMETKGIPLKSVAEIKVGFATLRDKAFMGNFDKGKALFVGNDGLKREVEIQATTKFYKVSEFNYEHEIDYFSRPIIYPYSKRIKSRPLISLKDFASSFPMAFEHLSTWKSELQSRGYGEMDPWHEWGRRQSLVADGPKLLTKTFDLRPTFRLDQSNALFCNGYSVKPKEIIEPFDVIQLKTFLESRFVYAYALITSFEIAGGFQCYQKNFIENICLPPKILIDIAKTDNLRFETEVCAFYAINISDLDQIIDHYGGYNSNAFT